jgi:hypothetical protein
MTPLSQESKAIKGTPASTMPAAIANTFRRVSARKDQAILALGRNPSWCFANEPRPP